MGNRIRAAAGLFLLTLLLSACTDGAAGSGYGTGNGVNQASVEVNPVISTREMASGMLRRIEHPTLLEIQGDQASLQYHLDLNRLEEFTFLTSAQPKRAYELAIVKVKAQEDLLAAKQAFEQRAMEEGKEFKVINKGRYLMFAVAATADQLALEFSAYFAHQ